MAPDFDRLARKPCPTASLASSGTSFFRSALAAFMLLVGRAGPAVGSGKLSPRVRGAHIDNTDGFQPGFGRLHSKQPGRLSAHHAGPELLFGGKEKVLVQRVGMDGHFDPLPSPRDDRQHGRPGIGDPHVVLELGHMFFGGGFLRERPGQHELGLEHRASWVDQAVQGRRHPLMDGVQDPSLHVPDGTPGIAFVPAPVEVLGDGAELDDQDVGQIFGLDLPSLLAPQPNQPGLVVAHDDPGVRAAKKKRRADEIAASSFSINTICIHISLNMLYVCQ